MKVKSESEVAQSSPTLSGPMDCSPPGSSAHGIFQARVLEWGHRLLQNIVKSDGNVLNLIVTVAQHKNLLKNQPANLNR